MMRFPDPTPHDYSAHGFGLDDREPTPPRSPLQVAAEAALMLPQLLRLVYRLLRDPDVPVAKKLLAGVVTGYVVSPVDLIPDVVPVLGQIDDIVMIALSIHLLIEAVPEDKQVAYWDGSEDAFDLVRSVLAWGAEMVPRSLRRYLP